MANVIKYSTTNVPNTIKKGNFYLGVNNVGYGPTEVTGFWNGIQPPLSGYTLYENKATQGPSIRVFNTDAELISFVNQIGGTANNIYEAINHFSTNNEFILANKDYEPIVTDGLILNLDARFTGSYPKGGTLWNDLSGSGNNGTLINGPVFDSVNGGSIVFDGINDTANIPFNGRSQTVNTVEMFFRWNSGQGGMFIGFTGYNIWTQSGHLGFNTASSDLWGISSTLVKSLGLRGTSNSNWHHYVFVFTNQVQNNKIYINSKLQTLSQQLSTTNLTSNRTFPTSFKLSGWNNGVGYSINGDYAYVRIYNKELTAQEILQNYNAIFYQYTNNLQNRVKFDGGFYEDTTNYTTEIIKEI